MTTTDKLDKLRSEILSTYHTIGMCDRAPAAHMRTLYAKHDAAWNAYDDALIRQQEARIAEQEAELAKFRELAREAEKLLCYNDPNFEDLAQRLAALHKEAADG